MEPEPASGTLIFLFTDLEGSTRLWEQLDREGGTAGAQLRAVYDTFTEGFTTADLTEARALLETDP